MSFTRALPVLIVMSCSPALFIACGDDDESPDTGQAGSGATKAGSGGSSGSRAAGSGGSKAGSGGAKSAAGNSGAAGGSGGSRDAGPAEDGGESSGDEGHEVICTDQQVMQLSLLDVPSQGEVRDESSQDGVFETFIDATGGGLTPTQSYTYVRFTDDGLKRVDISDEDAFTSLDWDFGVRRYVIRLNSGVAGPGEVTGARTAPMTTFDAVESVPEGLEYRTEEYFTETCDFVPDTSGIGAPATALSSFWSYSQCVAMTHNVYVIALKEPAARHVKLEVLAYYTLENQETCDSTGVVPMPSGAGNIRIRWAFLD